MSNRWVLIADDEKDFAEVLRQLLEEEGYSVEMAHDGLAALQIMKREGAPAALLLDMEMPRLDGLGLLRRLCSWNPKPEVIVMGAFPAREDHERFRRYGVRAVLPKPVDLDEILREVRAIIPTSRDEQIGS